MFESPAIIMVGFWVSSVSMCSVSLSVFCLSVRRICSSCSFTCISSLSFCFSSSFRVLISSSFSSIVLLSLAFSVSFSLEILLILLICSRRLLISLLVSSAVLPCWPAGVSFLSLFPVFAVFVDVFLLEFVSFGVLSCFPLCLSLYSPGFVFLSLSCLFSVGSSLM